MKLLKLTFLLVFTLSIFSCSEDETTEPTKNSMKATVIEGINSYQFESTNIKDRELNNNKEITADSQKGQIIFTYPLGTAVNDTVSFDLQSLSTASYKEYPSGDIFDSIDGFLVITKNSGGTIEGNFQFTAQGIERSVEITSGTFTYEDK